MSLILNGTNGLSDVDGTAATPAIRGTDANTGIFFPAADTIAFSEGGVESMRIDSFGNVGVGVVPSAWAVIKPVQVGLAALGAYLSNSYATVNTFFDGSNWKYITSDFANRYQQSSGQHQWYNAPSGIAGNTATFTQAMTLDASGNLLVGTTTSSGRLTVNSGYSNRDLVVGRNVTGSLFFESQLIYDRTTASAANVNVEIDPGSGAYLVRRSTSSLKYKKNVLPAKHGLADVMKLKPVTYQSLVEINKDAETVYAGFIAEDVHDAGLTEFVQYAQDGSPDALAYANMVSLCIKAIQEQQTLITQLQADVAALKEIK